MVQVCAVINVCGPGVCNERAARSLCHPQPAVSTSSLCNVSLLSACDLRCHPTQDDLPSRPRATHHPSEQLLRKLSTGSVRFCFDCYKLSCTLNIVITCLFFLTSSNLEYVFDLNVTVCFSVYD